MIGLALNSNNDIYAEQGALKRVDRGAQVVQNVRSRLLMYLSEWFLDTTAGVPYFEEIFTKPANIGNTESILKTVILRTQGMERLTEFSLDFTSSTRQLSVFFSGITTDGDAINSTVNIQPGA